MANREDLAIIRAARAGQAPAQLALGKRYLSGGNGLPQSLSTALHWLARAARADQAEAWLLIGTFIPYEVAAQASDSTALWYERAFDQGVSAAGLVFAQLVLQQPDALPGLRSKALKVLETLAQSGVAQAQWLLGQYGAATSLGVGVAPVQQWVERAADAGIAPAQHALAEAAWAQGDWAGYLQRALPLARALWLQYAAQLRQLHAPSAVLAQQLGAANVNLLVRCAAALLCEDAKALKGAEAETEAQQWRELAAYADDKAAQFALGLSHARMRADGQRASRGSANYKKAIRWLTLAGDGGMAEAWYGLSRIFLKPEFSQRSLTEAQDYLERAAAMGHGAAQLECGISAWRNRRDDPSNDVRALYWLQKAALHDHAEAVTLLAKICDVALPQPWALQAHGQLTRALSNAYPFLAARIELAVLFGLTQPEALLLNIKDADRGHCLVLDVRAQYARSKRRLILISTTSQRSALHRIGRLFEDVDGGVSGPEGNYRQRLYRLKTALPQLSESVLALD